MIGARSTCVRWTGSACRSLSRTMSLSSTMRGCIRTAAAATWLLPTSPGVGAGPHIGRVIDHRVRFFPQKLLARTFDDGPSADVTPRILKTLAEHKAHATFFVLGRQVKQNPDLLRQIVAAGHSVGNHSYSH